MKNRNLSSPILSAIVLSLVAFPLLSQAESGVANFTTTAPAAQPAPATATSGVTAAPTAKASSTYTVVAGDSLTSIAKKFQTTRKKLKALNNLASSTVKPGQILQVPSLTSAKTATTGLTPKAKKHHAYAAAQPVQDFDIPASTFASCPPVPSSDENADSSAPVAAGKPAPVAKLVSPTDLAAQPAPESVAPTAPTPRVTGNVVAPSNPTNHFAKSPANGSPADGGNATARNADVSNAPSAFNPPTPRLTSRGINLRPGVNSTITTPANDWGNRFLREARALGNQGIEYDEDWRPPGESRAWTMDCSNTSRYIYKVTTGIQLPRTASDQYYYLHLQGKAWDVPQTSGGLADSNFLRQNLKPGDLLFWENTYRPERQPPITHVMIFLGTNDKGQWIMAGSQSTRGGEHNRSNGGPDIYVFRPSQPCGGYSTWLGLVHHQGRFCAFGRPLEADPAKLAVAAND
jgi:LysM repeat protein